MCAQGSKLVGSVMGNNSYVGAGCAIEDSLVLGNDYYTNDKTRAQSRDKGESALGIGARRAPAALPVMAQRVRLAGRELPSGQHDACALLTIYHIPASGTCVHEEQVSRTTMTCINICESAVATGPAVPLRDFQARIASQVCMTGFAKVLRALLAGLRRGELRDQGGGHRRQCVHRLKCAHHQRGRRHRC